MSFVHSSRSGFTGVVVLLLSALGASNSVFGADLTAADQARLQAGILIATFDELSQRCSRAGGFDATQRAELRRWEESEGVARLRAHLQGPGLTPALREQVRGAAAQVIQQVAAAAPPCPAAVSLTRTDKARFSSQLPAMLAGSTAMPGAPSAPRPAPAAAAAPPATTPVSSGRAAVYAADIEGFGFDNCTRIGYGGMVMFTPCPVVLFKDGRVLTDVEALNDSRGLSAHRAASPEDWTKWRRQGGTVQLEKKKGWTDLGYSVVYAALPANFRLNGRFRAVGGTGNSAMGGGDAVVTWTDYEFTPDGRVRRGGGAGASSSGSGVDVTTRSQARGRSGRYRVDGLILAIDYDDGSHERRVIIADPKDGGRGTMWLDGEGYTVVRQ